MGGAQMDIGCCSFASYGDVRLVLKPESKVRYAAAYV